MTARWKFTADAPDKPLNSEAARWRKAMQDGMSLTPLSRYDGQPIYKIVYIAEHLHDLDEAKRLYQDQFVFCESNLDTMDDGMVNGNSSTANSTRAPASGPSAAIWATRRKIPLALATAITTCR